MRNQKKYKIAALISHPIQYIAPLFKLLAENPEIDLSVFYCSDQGIVARHDEGFGRTIKWDIPLLEGYNYKILKNYSPAPSVERFWGLMNFGIVLEILKSDYDAIIIHGYSLFTNWLAYITAFLKGTPIIFRGEVLLRENQPWYARVLKFMRLKPILLMATAFLSINGRSEEFYKHYGIPAEKVFFTPYAIDRGRFRRTNDVIFRAKEIRKSLGISETKTVLVFVGKLVPRKRPNDILSALKKIKDDGLDLATIFVGDGDLRAEMENFTRKNELRDVFFVGFANQGELPAYYAAADIFILPSTSQEVSPLVINEAMAMELPVLVSNAVPSARDFVKNGENGYIFKIGDVDELAERVRELAGDKDTTKKMGKESLRLIESWNYETCVLGVLEALKFSAKPKNG